MSAVRKAVAIAWLSLTITVRDRTALVWRLVMPLVMTVLVGSAFGGSAASMRLPVVVEDEDDSTYSRLFAERLKAEPTVRVRQTTASEAQGLLDSGRTAVIVLIPKGFADRINMGKDADVSVRFDPRRGPPTLVSEIVREVAMRLSVDAIAGEFTAALAVRETRDPSKAPPVRRSAPLRPTGAWWPIEIEPSYIQSLAYAVPQGWAMTGFVNIITRGFGLGDVLQQAFALGVFGAGFLVVGILLFKFE